MLRTGGSRSWKLLAGVVGALVLTLLFSALFVAPGIAADLLRTAGAS